MEKELELTADNIYLRLTAAGSLMFGWGREGDGYNEVRIANQNISSSNWYGVYIAHKGGIDPALVTQQVQLT